MKNNTVFKTFVVEGDDGYNCWPMIQAVGKRLICVYTVGKEHNPAEKGRASYSKYSDDAGKTWSERKLLFQNDSCGTSSIGKGLDFDGAALFWIRRLGIEPRMALYRTRDGESFELVSTPRLFPNAMQITDIFKTPEGLMCLWFSDDYSADCDNKCWGTLISADNGATWQQHVVERDLSLSDWPTEPSVAVLGNGRLLGIARSEGGAGAQYQLTSEDWGKTWRKSRTNITDVFLSTPTLVYDGETGIVRNYYYQRGAGLLKCRSIFAKAVFDHPESWPEPLIAAHGGTDRPYDSGNANAVALDDKDVVIYYSGDAVNCKVVVTVAEHMETRKKMSESLGKMSMISFDGLKNISIQGAGLEKPVKLIIASDTHFGFHDERDDEYADYYKRMARWPAEKEPFEKMLEEAKAAKPDALLLLGDIISFPTLANIDYVRESLEATGLNYIYTAGNHDWHFEGDSGSDLEQRDRWIEKRLKYFYQGRNPLMQSVVIGGLRIVMIDNSAYHVTPEQLSFWKEEAGKGDPVILCMHVPFWQPGYAITTCCSPEWGAANDPYSEIERRQRWADKLMPSTYEFRETVYATPNLVAVFAGHEHRLMFSQENGHTQIVVPWNRYGAYLEIDVK